MVRSKKRKEQSTTAQSDGKKSKRGSAPKDFAICKLLSDFGFVFASEDEDRNKMNIDQFDLQQKIDTVLKSKSKQDVIELLESLEKFWQDSKRFCISMLPTQSTDDCCFSSRGKQQDSLARILLGTEILQTHVAEVLMEKVAEAGVDNQLSLAASQLGDLNIIYRIICQLRWLDCIHNRKNLLQKMLEVLSVCELPGQQEIISCLPEFVDDEQQEEVSEMLQKLLIENSQLVSCVLDALNNINLKSEFQAQIRESVFKIMGSVDVCELPVIIKFLQNTVSENDALQVIKDIRGKLQFSNSVGEPLHRSTPYGKANDATKSNEALIFDSIRSGICFKKLIADTWTKVLEKLSSHEEQKVVDVYVIIVLYSLKHRRKTLNTLIRSKVKSGIFTSDNVSAAFHSHAEIYFNHLQDILLASETFLRSNDNLVSSFGANMYVETFCCFDVYSQQEVIGALVTHIGSGYVMEIEASFRVLQILVDKCTRKVCPFVVFLKGVLDFLENLTISQVRCLVGMISKLTSAQTHDKNLVVDDDMLMVVRKQLSSTSMKYKRIGVVGAIAILENIFDVCTVLNDLTEDAENHFKQVIDLLKLVSDSTKNNMQITSLFYDQLALVIKNKTVQEKVLSWMDETFVGEFQESFLTEADEVKSSENDKRRLAFDLDEPQQGGIAVNILPSTTTPSSSSCEPSKMMLGEWNEKMVLLPVHFRLVSQCEKKLNNGSLEGINGLLGCPMIFYNEDVMERIIQSTADERRKHCVVVLHAINWIRELLNSFCAENVGTDEGGKIISRIKTMVTLSNHLERLMSVTGAVNLPVVDFTVEDALLECISTSTSTSRLPHKPTKKSAERQGSGGNSTAENDAEMKRDGALQTSLMNYPASFRQLDLSVFYALSYKPVAKISNNTTAETVEEIKLTAEDVDYLLADLHRKLDYSLGTTKRSFLKQSPLKLIGFSNLPSDKKVATFMKKILESLCNQYDTCKKHLIKIIQDSNDDDNIEFSEESCHLFSIFNHLLKCFHLIFQWEQFRYEENKILLKQLLLIMVRSFQPDVKDAVNDVDELIRMVFVSVLPVDWLPVTLYNAVNVCKFLSTISSLTHVNYNNKKEEFILKLLQHEWYDTFGEKERGSKFNELLFYLIRTYIMVSSEPLEMMSDLCSGALSEAINNKEKDFQGHPVFLSLKKHSMIAFYKGVFEGLVAFMKEETHFKMTEKNNETIIEKLSCIQKVLKVFESLNTLLKEVGNKKLFLMSSLKYSRLFLESFLKCCMPLLDQTLRTNKDMVYTILRTAQRSTRSLQHLCGHSKVSKDLSLTTHVPALKKCLETFVFRVKAVLAHNNCDSVFWLGNLKNRDLQGNEIISQVSVSDSGEQDERDEEMNDTEDANDEYSASF